MSAKYLVIKCPTGCKIGLKFFKGVEVVVCPICNRKISKNKNYHLKIPKDQIGVFICTKGKRVNGFHNEIAICSERCSQRFEGCGINSVKNVLSVG